jgi:SpoVK/Ycf46/Vps4 family AAA+-type ATPase
LAVSGVQDGAVGIFAQPVESPALVTSPIDMPAIAQDLLRDAGLLSDGGGRGGCALLCGPRGTGKTLAAHMIAEALSLDLFRIDLAAVTSQFIAETERNLNALFAAVDRSGFVLLFDEADALFGQRTQIDGARDRYARDEKGFLVRQIESHTGLVVLTMNTCVDTGESLLAERLRKRYFRTIRFPRPGMTMRSR